MVDINFSGWSDEEYQKFLEQMKNHVMKVPQVTWQHHVLSSYGYEYREEQDIPLEQDENGVYGYKVLIRIRESPWFISPNRFKCSEWVDNKIQAHIPPTHRDDACGIYASKNMDLLKEWWDNYESYFEKRSAMFAAPVQLFAVKIRVWGVVVEHTKGLRAEYAEIIGVLKNGYW